MSDSEPRVEPDNIQPAPVRESSDAFEAFDLFKVYLDKKLGSLKKDILESSEEKSAELASKLKTEHSYKFKYSGNEKQFRFNEGVQLAISKIQRAADAKDYISGTWLWQIGFILYDPYPNAEKWKGNDHDELMIATMFFAWHVGAVLFVMLAIGAAVSCFHQRQKGIRNEEAESKHLKELHYDGQFLNSDGDTESDIEFQTLITK
ncbi:hypothetical protein FSP39_001834 [Pinctada imbricata]|uniref:Transmembrane protein n=1 Tax=Pinctada imbricata TaxID=66713 RepID=A0AA88YH05_PINIB|nr:hypothetical protein FSP39_001834 [Pinctada imbricata]